MSEKGKQKLVCIGCRKSVHLAPDEIPEVVKKGKAGIICDECNAPDWDGKCEVCGSSPVHRMTGMCGPCTFGEADTVGGDW